MREAKARSGTARLLRGATLSCALAGVACLAYAATTSSPFHVTVELRPDIPQCGQRTHGINVSVSCIAPGTPVAASPRFLLNVYREGVQVATVDGVTEPGTVASWKVVRVADRDFLEIVVGW
jgi:hypothetical protein